MPYLVEFLLFLLPFALFAVWWRLNPDWQPNGRLFWLAAAGLGCALAGAVWYGLSRSLPRGTAYVPAQMGQDGRIEHGGPGPAR